MRNANALYRGERPRLHYKTKSNVQFAWRCCGGGVAGEDLWTGRERGWEGRRRPRRGRGTTLTRVSSVGREGRGQVETRGAGDTARQSERSSPWMLGESHQKGHVDTHNNQTLPAPAICRGRSPPSQNEGDHWRLGKTAHLPEVSLFERFLSRARGVRPNRSTRTRRGLARRGGPTYSVAVLFGTFGGAPILFYTTAGDNLPPTLSAREYR